MLTVTKRTPQTQTDVEYAVWPSESIYEWVALDQRGELDRFIVWRERKRSGGLSSKLEKARSQSRVLQDSMIGVYWYGGDTLAYHWIRTAHILTVEVLGDSSACLVYDANLWQWSQEDICSALVNAQLAYHLSSDLPVRIFTGLTGLFICLSGWCVFKCVPIDCVWS